MMNMSVLLLIVLLFTGSVLSQVQVPCYGEGCVNVTVYLGPRWGSRVIMVPKTKTTTSPPVDDEHRPQHRPVPPGGEFEVDFMDDEYTPNKPFPAQSQTTRSLYKMFPWRDIPTTSRPFQGTTTGPTFRPHTDEHNISTVDLSWRWYTGEDVKRLLISIPESNRSQVTKLILDGNQISQLPVLVFPAEFEYGLEELSLNYVFFRPAYLTSYTRFELSRLARLKTLNMTHCGLRTIEIPNLPSLEVLDLSGNDLTTVQSSIGRLGNLKQLFLRGNQIFYIYNSPISSLTNLWMLDLSNNGLRQIQGEPLEHLSFLIRLRLDNNRLEALPLLGSQRSKIVSIANNSDSLRCTCALMRWGQHSNDLIKYDYFERCQYKDTTVPLRELWEWPEVHRHLCDDEGWWKHALSAVKLWLWRNSYIIKIVYKVVGVTTVVVVLLVLLRRWERLLGQMKPRGIPYNALDEQQVATVSGPHVDV